MSETLDAILDSLYYTEDNKLVTMNDMYEVKTCITQIENLIENNKSVKDLDKLTLGYLEWPIKEFIADHDENSETVIILTKALQQIEEEKMKIKAVSRNYNIVKIILGSIKGLKLVAGKRTELSNISGDAKRQLLIKSLIQVLEEKCKLEVVNFPSNSEILFFLNEESDLFIVLDELYEELLKWFNIQKSKIKEKELIKHEIGNFGSVKPSA